MRLFELTPCGDPCARRSWDVREYARDYRERTCVYRGDLSPVRGLRNAVDMLRRMYPGCRIRIDR